LSAAPEIDTEAFRARLKSLREELQGLAASSAESTQVVELDQAKVGRLSRMDAMQAQAMAQASGQRRAQMLQRITAALARIDSDEFGYCRDCEEAIPRKRLEFDPTSTRCVDCATVAESK
jgi:DnaK suppressor protein